jgi:hypothetical protein
MRQRQQVTTALLNPKPITAWRPGTLSRHGNAAIANLVAGPAHGQLPGSTIPGPVMAVR